MSEPVTVREPRYAWLQDALDDSSIVLTASRRLARELRVAHDQQQLADGRTAWDSPQVFYWHDWCRTLLLENAAADSPRILSSSASTVLWERSFRQSTDAELLGVGALVRQAVVAWQRLHDWCVPPADVKSAAGNSDERLFVRVSSEYRRALGKQGWIDGAELPAAAVNTISAGAVMLPKAVVIAGFDRHSPLFDKLLQTLRARGCSVSAAPVPPPGRLTARSFADVEAELRAAGHWARRILERRPSARIAVVSSDLNTDAMRHARLLREGLAPGWQTGSADYRHSVNVSFGRRLAEYPAIATALLVLRWVTGGLAGRDVSTLLRSDFLRGHDPALNAALDLELRRLPDRPWSAAALVDALSQARPGFESSRRLEAISQIAKLAIRSSERASPAYWAAGLHELLEHIGWPGDEVLDSEDFQLVNRWRELLNEFAALDVVLPTITLREAIAKLAALSADTVYQAETGAGLVSLLGSLEAAGMEFDDLWVIGMDADRWPAPGNPLALVSRRLQRNYAMPDADPANSLDFSKRVLHRLIASASAVTLSRSEAEDDTQLMPSPLLNELAATIDAANEDPGWYATSWLGAAAANRAESDPAPAVQATEQLSGGSGVIALQWRDPFMAFAVGRLAVSELDVFQPGLTPRLRGIILHEALQHLMQERPSRDELRSWIDGDIAGRIERSVDRAIARNERHADAVLRRLLAFERRRLIVVLEAFVHAECDRSPFRVAAVEKKLRFEHAGLALTLRADRIDSLSDGSVQILDYKSGSGKHRIVDQDGDVVEPQLLVYAAATSKTVNGLVLISVTRRAIEYTGVGGEWGKISAEDWPGILQRWKQRVFESLELIAAGDVRVNVLPGDSPHPQLDVLSRVEELRRRG